MEATCPNRGKPQKAAGRRRFRRLPGVQVESAEAPRGGDNVVDPEVAGRGDLVRSTMSAGSNTPLNQLASSGELGFTVHLSPLNQLASSGELGAEPSTEKTVDMAYAKACSTGGGGDP